MAFRPALSWGEGLAGLLQRGRAGGPLQRLNSGASMWCWFACLPVFRRGGVAGEWFWRRASFGKPFLLGGGRLNGACRLPSGSVTVAGVVVIVGVVVGVVFVLVVVFFVFLIRIGQGFFRQGEGEDVFQGVGPGGLFAVVV